MWKFIKETRGEDKIFIPIAKTLFDASNQKNNKKAWIDAKPHITPKYAPMRAGTNICIVM
jgi:hypothetical protein